MLNILGCVTFRISTKLQHAFFPSRSPKYLKILKGKYFLEIDSDSITHVIFLKSSILSSYAHILFLLFKSFDAYSVKH